MPITVTDSLHTTVSTSKLSAAFYGARLVWLKDAAGRTLLHRDGAAGPPGIELAFADGDVAALGRPGFSRVRAVQVSQSVAHVHVEDDDGDACLRIAVAPGGELLVEPSAQTIRRGLAAVRWNLAGVAPGYKLVAPFFQGCRQELEHPLVTGPWMWPQSWEAALVILQGAGHGWSVCAHDTASRPKMLHVGHEDAPRTLGLDSEALGPWDQNTVAGSLTWIIDAHAGDWTVAADAYRRWLHEHINAAALKALRPAWIDDIRLTVQWCPCDGAILDALERVIAPAKVLLHVPRWRSDPYDVNYPEYAPSPEGKAFIAQATQRGFRVLPHFNHFAIDPNHPFFARVRDFMMRDVRSKKLLGWRWRDGRRAAFPQSQSQLPAHRDEKTMVYLHTGLSTWRRELAERVAAAMGELAVAGVFVDQTLATYNLDNAMVENLTSADGVVALTRELAELDGRPAVGGEGLDEMTMRYLSFAQVHLYRSWHRNCPHFDELDPVPLGARLWADLCRPMSAKVLDGDTPETELRIETHHRLGALPTIHVQRAEQIAAPTPGVRRVLERATS